MSTLAEDHVHLYFKYFVLFVLSAYMLGAMILKFVAGAESFVDGISMTIFNDTHSLDDLLYPFKPYWIGLLVFYTLSVMFSLGNIENSKVL